MPTMLLIDADILIYKTCWAVEDQYHWCDDLITLGTNFNELKYVSKRMIEDYKDKLNCKSVMLAFSDYEVNFRKELDPTYKMHRKGSRKPLGFQSLSDWLMSYYPYDLLPGLEADDTLGIYQTKDSEDTCIVSIDKDMLTIPGAHYNPDKEKSTVINDSQADYNWLTQTLVGDSTDGYPGCPGVGPKTSEKMFAADGCNWFTVMDAYRKKGLTVDDAVLQARLARILRSEDYNFETKEIIPWKPPVN